MVVNASSESSPFFPITTTGSTATNTTTTTNNNNTTPKRRSLDNNGLPRPPTPPRESPRSKKASTATAKDPFATTDSNILLAESSPPPSSESSAVDKPKKRVLWSPWTKYHKPDVPLTSTPIRSLIDAKNLKSILKPSPIPLYTDSPLGRPIAAHTFTSFASMLESVLTSLASPERSRKLDTYITFSNTLKAYDEIPDMPALEAHLPALCDFIRRDLTAKLEDGGNTDSQLIQQAIKLLVILAWTPRLVEAMDDTNAAFFLEHAIARIEDAATPKIIVNHNLHLLAQQKFPARVMTPERANRIVTALETLDERVTGKSITKERIDIYYKLLYQAKLVMTARISDWMDNLFGGLLSSVTEVRNRALICIAEVSRVLGKDKAVPRTLTNIFSRQVKGKRMFESIKERLDQFIRDGEGVFVARMWGIVLLCVKTLGDHWEYFTPWLRIIEGCFNVSDKDVKVEAQVAWSKLIYSMNIGPNTTRKLLGLLCKPLEQYLDPKNAYSNTKKPRKAAMANVSVLLYYGFRPTATNKQLSDVWDLVVVGLVEKMALSSKEEVGEGCSILSAIFDSTRPRPWQETRVLATPPMAPEDVPRLDPKWVRSNTALVLNTLEVALRRGHWKEEADKGVKSLWAHFTKTLSDAGSKEIKVSAELMEAVAHLFNMFQRIWAAGPSALLGAKEAPPTVSASFIKKFSFLVVTALQSLGTIPFTEKHLAYDDATKFAPAATPTHKYSSGGSPAVLNPPILHLFQLFLNPPADVFPDEEYYESVRTILWKCVAGQDSRRKKLGLLASCTALLPHRDARELDHGMWQIFGQLARKCLAREKLATLPPVVAEFRDVVRVLEWGCPYELQGWRRLYEEFCAVVAAEQGEGYVAAVVVEPIAEVLRNLAVEMDKTQSLKKAVMLVEHAAWPKAEKSFLKTPFGGAGRRSLGSDAYEKLCDLLDHLLKRSYALCAEGLPMTDTLALMAALGDMLTRCPSGGILPLLKRLQEGLGLFIADEKQVVGTKNTDAAARIYNLWVKVLETLTRLPAHDGKILDALQGLVTAGLQSRRKQIVNVTVRFWNDTFGEQSSLLYPPTVRSALKKLRPIADLVLPTFPESIEDESANTPPEFSETQSPDPDGDEDSARENNSIAWPATPLRMASPFRKSMSPGMMVKDTPLQTTTTSSRRTTPGSARKAPPPKPKHMDSQIEFAPVDNGAAGAIDSQVLTEHQKEVKERQRNGEAGKLFSSLVVKTEKGKGKEREREREREVVVLEDTPVEDMDVSRIEETQVGEEQEEEGQQQQQQEEETISFISEMPVPREDSNPQFLLTRPPTQESGDVASSSEIELSSEPEMDSPGAQEWEESNGDDVEMSNPTDADVDADDNSDYGSSISELPSIEDDFVDAPDQPPPSNSSRSSSPRKNMMMKVEVAAPPPSATLSAEERPSSAEKSGNESPDAQIIDEQRASHGLPATPKPAKGKRRARKKASPEVLGTIVIASEPPPAQESSVWYRTRSTRLAEEKERQGSLEVPEAGGGSTKVSKPKSVENTPSRAAKNATPSKALKGKKTADTPSRKGKAVEATPSRVSPPRTRASARRGVSETPKAIVEPASRKRKFLATDDSPVPGYESHQSGTEHAPSPTPKGRRRRSDNPPPAKRGRVVEEVPADPDVSFVGETQLSYGSSIPDTYEQEVDELVRATPYAGRAVGIFDKTGVEAEGEVAASTPGGKRRRVKEMVEETPVPAEAPALAAAVEEEGEAVQEEEGEEGLTGVEADAATPSKRRKMKKRQPARAGRRSPAAKGGQKSLTETEEDEATPPSSQVEISAASESTGATVVVGSSGPSVVVSSSVVSSAASEPVTGRSAIEGLRSALGVLETVGLTQEESRETEEIILGAFMNIRRRGRE